eukprot:TRINITY_DN1592_c0_g2_i10.p1 TRINITY_DN1592_c0_g2~~TRINITY_DN1592_c0_g2_i10.p1  ORF type:complete len:282 (-),score=53.45 TRINITY_DN1592_c0_g2_i10:28-873(-)
MSQLPPILGLKEDDVRKMLACSVHIGSTNLSSGMERYVTGRNEIGNHIIDIRKTWEKLVLAARVIAAVENPKDVCVVGLSASGESPHAQRAVLKFGKHVGSITFAGRFTPGTFTNQLQSQYVEPTVLVVSDPIRDHQPLMESSYMNIPVIAFCNTGTHLRNIDIVIPCNTGGTHSIALMYWMLAREVLRLKGKIPRQTEWTEMVDMFIYKDPEEQEKTAEESSNKTKYQGPWTDTDNTEWDQTANQPTDLQQENWNNANWVATAEIPVAEWAIENPTLEEW